MDIIANCTAKEINNFGYGQNKRVFKGFYVTCLKFTYENALKFLKHFPKGFHNQLKIAVTMDPKERTYVTIGLMKEDYHPIHKAFARAKSQMKIDNHLDAADLEMKKLQNEEIEQGLQVLANLQDF